MKTGGYYTQEKKSIIVGVVVVKGEYPVSLKDQKHQFSVGGVEFSLSREQAVTKLNSLKAQDIEEVRKIYVEVKGRRFPIKQALAEVQPDIMRSGCNSSDGIRVFRKLGLKVGEL
jgi:hypothetical protein